MKGIGGKWSDGGVEEGEWKMGEEDERNRREVG